MCVVFKTLGREKLNEENSTNNMETYIAGRGAETTRQIILPKNENVK